jgi:hypothetical protein
MPDLLLFDGDDGRTEEGWELTVGLRDVVGTRQGRCGGEGRAWQGAAAVLAAASR